MWVNFSERERARRHFALVFVRDSEPLCLAVRMGELVVMSSPRRFLIFSPLPSPASLFPPTLLRVFRKHDELVAIFS
jgi:hypothetical protein